MDICHFKIAGPKVQKYKGRVSGACAVLTEQGSSAYQMTAAKIMDVIARLPDCDGQAADAESADTEVKLEDAPRLRKTPSTECLDVWIRFPRRTCPKSWASIEDPVVSLERNLYGHPLAGLWERQFEEVLLEQLGWEKISEVGMSVHSSKKGGYVCQFMWMTSTCLERSCDMEGHAQKCVERYWQLYRVSSPFLDYHQFKQEGLENCLEMLVLGTNWKTRHSVVGQQGCKISHKMNSCM